jgi:endonuclease YncB( thermonuclease family)
MSALPFGLLVVALLLFLLSTRQSSLGIRAAAWVLGVAALGGAIALVIRDSSHSGLFRALVDFVEHWSAPADSVLAQGLSRNAPNVQRFVLPLLDLFLVLAVVLGIVTLLSFTPGERLEKLVRPLAIGLVGAVAGGTIALAVVGTGFGGVARQRVYANYVSVEDIHDGDTFWVGETSVRLLEVDAPERAQICRRGAAFEQCGEEASRHLGALLDGALVTCDVAENGKGRSRESFGRPLVTCRARTEDGEFDVGRRMILDGYAVAYSGGPSPTALREGRGFLDTCTLHPRVWRRDTAARNAFLASGALPGDAESRVGRCNTPDVQGG